MKVMLRLRDLQSGEASTKEFETLDSTIPWLKERPPFVDVMGVVFEGLTHEQNDKLKAAMRPLDEAELGAERALKAAEDEARRAREEAAKREMAESDAAQRDAVKNADKGRPMDVRFHYSQGISASDQYDDRPINDDVKAAVQAWVDERNEWLADRGQMIGEAKLQAYPGDVPEGKERVVSGSFVPVSK